MSFYAHFKTMKISGYVLWQKVFCMQTCVYVRFVNLALQKCNNEGEFNLAVAFMSFV